MTIDGEGYKALYRKAVQTWPLIPSMRTSKGISFAPTFFFFSEHKLLIWIDETACLLSHSSFPTVMHVTST